MYLFNNSFTRCCGLFFLFFTSITIAKAQSQEIGLKVRTLNYLVVGDLEENPLDPSDRSSNFNLGLYFQKDLEKFYLRYSAGVGTINNWNRSSFTIGNATINNNVRRSYLSTTVGFEIGKNVELGKRFRLQAGAEINLAKAWVDKELDYETVWDTSGFVAGYEEVTLKNPRGLSVIPLLVLRGDLQVSNRIRIGAGMDWGFTFNVRRGNRETTYREFDLNDQFIGETQSSFSVTRIQFSARNLSRPFLNIGFILGK